MQGYGAAPEYGAPPQHGAPRASAWTDDHSAYLDAPAGSQLTHENIDTLPLMMRAAVVAFCIACQFYE